MNRFLRVLSDARLGHRAVSPAYNDDEQDWAALDELVLPYSVLHDSSILSTA